MMFLAFLSLCLICEISGLIVNKYSKSPHTNLFAITDISTKDLYEQVTTTTKTIVIDFQKSKCKPCTKVAPLFQKLSERYAAHVEFYKVDGDSSREALMLLKESGLY